mmetsp:Transcript_19090/g.76064  ORF Transcript_19090/g.76064 Transcript_19090/m.76064 type:complete len:283 (-) Transcript_19090:2-850(-)
MMKTMRTAKILTMSARFPWSVLCALVSSAWPASTSRRACSTSSSRRSTTSFCCATRDEKREKMSPILLISDSMVWAWSSRRRAVCSSKSCCCCCCWRSWSRRRALSGTAFWVRAAVAGSKNVGAADRRFRRPPGAEAAKVEPPTTGGRPRVVCTGVDAAGPIKEEAGAAVATASPVVVRDAAASEGCWCCGWGCRRKALASNMGESRRTRAAELVAPRPAPTADAANLLVRRWCSLSARWRATAQRCTRFVRSASCACRWSAIWRSKCRRCGPLCMGAAPPA